MPYSSCVPPFVLPDSDLFNDYAKNQVYGVVAFSRCHDFALDRHPMRTDDDYLRGFDTPVCANRTRMGERAHNWCLRCIAGFPLVHLDKHDSERDRDALIA